MMPIEVSMIRSMVKKFVDVVGVNPPHESAVLNLAKRMRNLSIDASKKVFRSMQDSWKFKDFPRPADWAGVIEQAAIIDESAKKVAEFICNPEEKPTDADWESFNRAIADFGVKHSIPAEDSRPYMSPEECMVGWQKRQDELHDAIRHLDRHGLIQPGQKKKREKARA